MSKITCPKCGHQFDANEVDLTSFKEEVEKEVKRREAEISKIVKFTVEKDYDEKINKLNKEISDLNNQLENKDREIEIAVKEERTQNEAKIVQLTDKINVVKIQTEAIANNKLKEKDVEIASLKGVISLNEEKSKTFLIKELEKLRKEKDDEIDKLNDQIKYYKDYRMNLNVKEIGEDLEQYCFNQFTSVRAASYPLAYFEKDSDISKNNNKADYIYRDYVQNGEDKMEFVSIIFDMKNEQDDSEHKHKNVDFLKKLDSDRKAKNCEYAILVTTLEKDSKLYESGIVDMSHIYPKTYIIRPQYFLQMIALIKNASLNSVGVKQQLVEYQNKNVDIVALQTEIDDFKTSWGKNMNLASEHFKDVIDDIDATIKKLQKTRDDLVKTNKQLGYADTKVNELSLTHLAKNSPSIKAEIKELEKQKKS